MKFLSKVILVSSLAVSTVAFAAATDPTVIARQNLMKMGMGANTKVLGDMAGGKTAFDATAAEAARAALAAAAAQIPAKFEPQATDPETKAKPEIWTNWSDFVAKAKALETAAAALDASSLATVQAGMAAIGGACTECHKANRNAN